MEPSNNQSISWKTHLQTEGILFILTIWIDSSIMLRGETRETIPRETGIALVILRPKALLDANSLAYMI